MNKIIRIIKSKIISYQLKKVKIKGSWFLNEDLSVTVYGDVVMSGQNLSEIPVKFNIVTGDFDCAYNQIKTLKNAPNEVGGSFCCETNKLTNLKGVPHFVGKHLLAGYNMIDTLVYFPERIGENASLMSNPIDSIDTLPYTDNLSAIILSSNSNNTLVFKKEDLTYRKKEKATIDLNTELTASLNSSNITNSKKKMKI